MKLLTLLVFASWALAAGLQAQTPDVLVRNGRDALSRSNLVEADKQFGAALRQNPYHAEANVLQAGTRAAVAAAANLSEQFSNPPGGLPHRPPDLQLDRRFQKRHQPRLGAARNGQLLRSGGAGEIPDAARAPGLGNELGAYHQHRVRITAFGIGMLRGETVAVDYGDVQLLRAFLYAGEFLSYTVNAHNFNVVLNRLLQLEKTDALSFQRLLSENPSLLAKGGAADLGRVKEGSSPRH